MRRALVLGLVAGTLAVLVPPAHAEDPALGGYTASAEAAVVRVGVYEPAVPIPAEPQVDAGIGFARATTATGPSARGLASYLWPGDAVGDGLGVLLGNEALDYPVKTSSSYPATDTGPATNAVQINAGNGMSTSADGRTTRARVVGLGLGNGIGDPGAGLCRLLGTCPDEAPRIDLPDPIAATATIEHLASRSSVALGDRAITATARTTASGISVLGGLITIDTLDVRAESSSDGARARTSGVSRITGLRVLGRRVDLGDPVSLDGKDVAPPRLPQLLEQLGIRIEYLQNQRTQAGESGSLAAQALTITVDVAPLRRLLRLGGLSELLAPALTDVDQAGPLLLGLLKLGTRIVVTVGDVRTRATASPAYEAPVAGPVAPPSAGPVEESAPFVPGAAPLPGLAPGTPATAPTPSLTGAPASVDLPGLGRVPTWFVLAGLALVALAGWGVRGFGTWIFAGGSCALGSSVGVPDLRKARSA